MESTIASIPSTSAAATVTNSTPSHIIIFDFDYSLINVNSDTYVPEYFAPELESYIKNEIKFNIVSTIGMSETGIRVKTY